MENNAIKLNLSLMLDRVTSSEDTVLHLEFAAHTGQQLGKQTATCNTVALHRRLTWLEQN